MPDAKKTTENFFRGGDGGTANYASQRSGVAAGRLETKCLKLDIGLLPYAQRTGQTACELRFPQALPTLSPLR